MAVNPAAADAAPPAGSDFHYASFYFDPATRARLWAIEALRRELSGVPASCSDRGVAHIKLAWWREEIERLNQREPRHGLSRALLPALEDGQLDTGMLLTFIDHIDHSLVPKTFAQRDDMLRHVDAVHGPLLSCLAACADRQWKQRSPAQQARIRSLLSHVELGYAWRDLRHHRLAPTVYLAADVLEKHQCSIEALRDGHHSETLAVMLNEEFDWLSAELEQLVNACTRGLRRDQRCALTLARIQLKAIALTVHDGCEVLKRRVELTPVDKLLIAWRTRWLG